MRLNLFRSRSVVLMAVMLTGVGMAAEPIGFWRFNGDLTDSAGGADGVFNGGTPGFAPGVAGQAVAFDGVDDHVDVMIGNTDAYTISAWVKPARLGAASIVARTSASGTTVHWSHQVRMTAGNVFEHYTYDGAAKSVIGTTQIEVDTWYHVGITASNNGDIRLYVNGQEEGAAAPAVALWTGGDRYAIGSNSGNAMGWFLGSIDDVRIYDIVLPQQEIMPALNTASGPRPGDAAVDVLRDSVLMWKPSEQAATHNVYLGVSFEDVNTATVPTASDLDVNSFGPGRLDLGQTYFWRVDEVNAAPDKTVFKGDVWRFTAEPLSIQIPGADIITTASSVSNEFSMPEKTLDGSGLGANDTHAIDPETMWFTAAVDLDPWIQYEFDDIYKMDVMAVWNSNGSAESAIGWGVKDVQIQYSVDGETWEILADVTQFSRAPGSPSYNTYDEIGFGGVAAKYVRLDIQSNWGGILMSYGLSEVQFYVIPAAARTPQPASGAVDVLPNAVVSWRAGREADQSIVYVSADPNEVADGVAPSVTSSTNSLDLTSLDLQLGQAYYWRVDEVNEAEAIPVWAGPVWNFSTVAAWIVDDFESYNNLSPDRPFQTWLDGFGYSADEFFSVGYGGNGTGAGIGHDIWSLSSPYYDGLLMETVIVLPGSGQSMPFYYSNTGGVASETQVKFADPQNWAGNGIKTLVINIFGAAGNSGQLYLKINNTKVVVPSDVDIQKGGWQLWPVDLSTVAGNIGAVTSLAFGVDGASASGLLYIDDIRLYPRDTEYVTPSEPDSAKLLAYYPFDGNAKDSSGNGHHGAEVGAPAYVAGTVGQAIALNGFDDYVDVVVDIPEDGGAVSFWFNTTDPDCGLYCAVDGVLGAGGHDRHVFLVNGNVGARIHNAANIIGAGVNVADGQWHHVAHTFGAAVGGQKLYVDGLLVASNAKAQSDFDWQKRVHFGFSNDGVNNYTEGLIDEARIYNSALSLGEVGWLAGWTEPMVKPF